MENEANGIQSRTREKGRVLGTGEEEGSNTKEGGRKNSA